MVLRDKQGAIASQYATDQCAYTIEAPVGQRINITVTDFSQERLNMSSSTSHLPSSTSHLYSRGTHICQQLLVVTDDGYDVTTVCREGARRRHVYESRSHAVTLQLKGVEPYDALLALAEAHDLDVRYKDGIVVARASR